MIGDHPVEGCGDCRISVCEERWGFYFVAKFRSVEVLMAADCTEMEMGLVTQTNGSQVCLWLAGARKERLFTVVAKEDMLKVIVIVINEIKSQFSQ